MCVYTLYILVICLSVQSSLGNDVGDADYQILLKPQHDDPGPSNGTIFPKSDENDKVCDKAVTLQKILGVMLTMLRQDLSENFKTAYILETLKDLLKNTAGYNNEVTYKIDDLLRTLDKDRDNDVSKDKTLRAGLHNLNSPMKILVRKPTKLNQNTRLTYELPALTNSYCTEALLNIIKIAYQTYESLAKNPICNLPTLPDLPPGIEIPDINPHMKPILEPTPNLKPQPGIGENVYTYNLPSFLVPELQSHENPSNISPNNLVPNVDIINLNPESPTIEYKPVYEYNPTVNDEPINISEWPVHAPQIPNYLTPDRPDLHYPTLYKVRPSYPTGDVDSEIPLRPYLPQNADILPFDFSSPSLENPVQPYNSILQRYPEFNPQNPITLPWQKNYPDFPFDVKPHSTPLNPYYPDVNNPNSPTTPNVPVPLPWGKMPRDLFRKPQLLNPNVKENPEEMFFEIPLDTGTPNNFPLENEINPASTKYLHTDNLKYLFPRPLPSKPETKTPKYMPLVHYSPDAIQSVEGLVNPYAESEFFEFPYQADTLKFNDVPLNPLVKYPNNPSAFDLVTDNDSPTTEVYEFKLNPDESELDVPLSVSYPFMSNNLAQEFEFKPKELSPNAVQNPTFEFELNPDGALMHPSLPNPSPYDWISKTPSATTPQDNPFFPEPVPPPNTLQVPELNVTGFIRDAISFIEEMIPVVKFDPPTLYIIAKIKNILVQNDKDIEADEYATILELYTELINYVKQLNVYKQIIDLIDLPAVTNRSKLKTKKVVELTYLVKRPQPVVYYPYYYVKYRLPYPSFVVAAQNLLKEKSQLRTNPNELYEKLLALSKVAETSPDLKTYDKKDLLGLTFKTGSLVDAKLVGDNETLTGQLNVLKDITSDLTAEEILKLNKEAKNQVHYLATNSETVNDQKIDNDEELRHLSENKLIKTDKTDKEQDAKHLTSPLTPDVSLRTDFLANNYQNDPKVNMPTEPSLEFTSFDSGKLRNDILRGEQVGLPFPDALQTNVSPLYGHNEPNLKDRGLISPAMYKLVDATLDASNLRDANQQNFMNSGGLANLDTEIISLNTGKANHQASINISNPKIMINSAATINNLLNSGKTKNSGDFSQQASLSQQNMWSNQQNYYNSGGLVNFDNQKISLNKGTGNSQDGVNFINPKVMLNKATDSISEHTKISAPDQFNSINLNPISDGTTSDTTQTGSNTAYVNPTKSYGEETISPDDLFNFGKKGMGIPSQKGNMNVGSPKDIFEPITKQSLIDVGVTQPPYTETPDKQDMSNIIKKSVSEDVRQFENEEDAIKLPGKGEKNNQDFFNNYHNTRPWNIGTDMPGNNDLPSLDNNNFLITAGQNDVQHLNYKNNMAANGAANKDLINFDDSKVVLNPGPGNEKNSVSPNNNQWFPHSAIGNQDIGYNFAGTVGQQGIEGGRQLNIANLLATGIEGEQVMYNQQNFANFGFKPAFSGQQAISSQQNFANFGINPVVSGGYMMQSVPIIYKRPSIERLPVLNSSPFIARFTRPGLYYG